MVACFLFRVLCFATFPCTHALPPPHTFQHLLAHSSRPTPLRLRTYDCLSFSLLFWISPPPPRPFDSVLRRWQRIKLAHQVAVAAVQEW